jgi:hypothetical protein
LRQVFDSTSKTTPSEDSPPPDPQGAQASLLALPGVKLPASASSSVSCGGVTLTGIPSNECLAEDAQTDLGTSFLSIGNTNDFLWNPQACFDTVADVIEAVHPSAAILRELAHLAHLGIPDFRDTQFLEDEGNGNALYGRSFTSGNDCVLSTPVGLNHGAVFTNASVQTGIRNFLTPISVASGSVGGTPSPLVAVPNEDIG